MATSCVSTSGSTYMSILESTHTNTKTILSCSNETNPLVNSFHDNPEVLHKDDIINRKYDTHGLNIIINCNDKIHLYILNK